jgi:hypothetical protein
VRISHTNKMNVINLTITLKKKKSFFSPVRSAVQKQTVPVMKFAVALFPPPLPLSVTKNQKAAPSKK